MRYWKAYEARRGNRWVAWGTAKSSSIAWAKEYVKNSVPGFPLSVRNTGTGEVVWVEKQAEKEDS